MSKRVSVGDWPRITRFYGIGPFELARLPYAILRVYAEQLPRLAAEEALLGFTTADLPYADKGDRKKIHRAFEQYVDKPEPEKLDVRTTTGAQAIAGFGIGVYVEPTEVESSEETTDA